MNDAEQEARQHQAQRRLRSDARAPVVGAVQLGYHIVQPAQVEDPIDPNQDVVVGDQVTQRTGKERELLRPTPTQRPPPPARPASSRSNHADRGSSTASADIMAKDGDIFGDGVNIAARLQALAGAGGICVSRGVRDQIRHIGAYPDGSLALLAKAMLEELRPTSSG